jgi:alpha-N-acetylglucosaminidase
MMKSAMLAAILSPVVAFATVETASLDLIRRTLPDKADRFIVESIPAAESGRDVFEIESRDGRIVLRGNNGLSVASALKRYLQEFCHADPAWLCGGQMNLPAQLPPVSAKIRVASPYKFRFMYNYCTHGYTMAWWDWKKWERELDCLAMHGINLALIIQGQEQVWIEALKEFGYTDAEVRKWLCMPSHQPWQYMSNMEDYGGPVPETIVKKRTELGRKIILRMRELGMEPVQQGYYGIVPSDFTKRFPGAKVHPQGNWSNLKRPDMLDPSDPLFAKFAQAFYREQKKLFGDARFLAADPFHEGGTTAGINLGECARQMFAAMDDAYPGVTWVFQSWQANPRQPMLDALDKSRCLVLDLFCEREENWRSRKEFGSTPWLWCIVQNFGGNSGLNSRLDWVGQGPVKALHDAAQTRMAGIGGLMEGSDTIPAVWERLFDNAWRGDCADARAWLHDYVTRRYGASKPAEEAWSILLATCYDSPGGHGEFPVNSVVCGRPSLNPEQRARPYTGTRQPYDTTRLVEAWRFLMDAAPDCEGSDGYRYDLADVGRQVMADLGTRYHQAIVQAFNARDAARLRALSDKMVGLIRDMDRLAATRPELLFGVWLADARAWGDTPGEKDLCEWNARTLLTTWTVPESHIDYANRQWSGLLGAYYLQRWKIWLAALNEAVGHNESFDQGAVRRRIQEWEYAWTRKTQPFPTQPSGDTISISLELFDRHAPDARNPALDMPTHMEDATKEAFVGRWRYSAEGTTFEREIKADGSIQLYRNGAKLDWDGFTWRFDKGVVEMRRANGSVFGKHVLRDKETLLFVGEAWGPAVRVISGR